MMTIGGGSDQPKNNSSILGWWMLFYDFDWTDLNAKGVMSVSQGIKARKYVEMGAVPIFPWLQLLVLPVRELNNQELEERLWAVYVLRCYHRQIFEQRQRNYSGNEKATMKDLGRETLAA